ncbi:MAG: hypothetical protein MI808_16205, partial [Pseudomonadales bacterium]|nr:hypothetical protein [Pseudomonadales bacterium]
MKGLYINIPSAEEKVSTFADTLRAPIHIEQVRTPSGQHILVDNHIENWPQGAIHNDQNSGSVIAASGYLVYKDVLGNLQQFLTDFVAAENQAKRLSVCDQIQAGSFVIYIETPNNHYLITDPFGLNPHYQDKQSASLIVAPVPTFVAPDRETDTALCRIIEKNRHLFGNLTGIVDVERLEPGALIHNTGLDFYFNYFSDADTLENTRQLMEKGLGYFSERKKILPLSGGLDSRYLLSVAKMDYGYTYGPEQTGDRPIARTFSKLFEEYREFSLLDFSYPKPLQEAGDGIFKGTVGRPLSELLVLYQDCCNRWGQGCVFIDGYMGDTLQRGIYFNITGAKGVLFRILPGLMFRFSSPEQLLLARYE